MSRSLTEVINEEKASIKEMIDCYHARLDELESDMDDFQKAAICLHSQHYHRCADDSCDWGWEIHDGKHDWNGRGHQVWLQKAKELSQ